MNDPELQGAKIILVATGKFLAAVAFLQLPFTIPDMAGLPTYFFSCGMICYVVGKVL